MQQRLPNRTLPDRELTAQLAVAQSRGGGQEIFVDPGTMLVKALDETASIHGFPEFIAVMLSCSTVANGAVQAALWILFVISFLANAIAGARYALIRLFRGQQGEALRVSDKARNFKRALCVLNLLILIALGITTVLVLDQMHPSCPAILMYLPFLGTVSTVATVVLLIVLARTPRDRGRTAVRRICFSLEVLCLVLFVPYMFYWNLIGFRF